MIPAQAVEAAAKVLRARFNGQREDKPWASADQMRMYIGDARAALEAAAPYICGNAKAEAWEEGYEQADSDAPHSIKSENPYRDQGTKNE